MPVNGVGDGQFITDIFNIFDAWGGLPYKDPRAAVAPRAGAVQFHAHQHQGLAGIKTMSRPEV